VQSYAVQILDGYANELSTERAPAAARIPAIRTVTRDWYNPTLDYKHYMVPGILVALVTIIGTLVTAQNIAREKELGTLEQLNVTPITKAEFITAKLLPFWVLALVDLGVGLAVGYFVFHVPMRGNPVLLFASAGVYLVVALGIGLWISTLVETQQQAMFVTFFVLMIYLLMSGLFTPVESMPGWVQTLSLLNPVRHFVTISRAILIKGAGAAEIVKPFVVLAVYGVVVLTLAVRQYNKTVA
jgi:ABC-2 type transport system permease protein